eukprot:3406567-Rhodomonas_salina.1
MSPSAGQEPAGEEVDPNTTLDVSTPLTKSIDPPQLIRLVITGLRESGKTSIMEVLWGSIPALTQGQMSCRLLRQMLLHWWVHWRARSCWQSTGWQLCFA